MLGQFPMIDAMVREQERELNKTMRRIEEDIIAENAPGRRQPLDYLMKLLKR
jgi:hypothetical protein